MQAPSSGSTRREEPTDLGSLWTSAVADYLKKTGKSLSHDMGARSMSDVMNATEVNMKDFQSFRHKGDKSDKVRSAFGRHLGGMQKCMQGIEMVGNLAGAFPPAMPVGLVFAACGHLLAAFAGVKADYDKVEDFFNHSSRFFERLSIIEGKDVDKGSLGKAVVRVFSAQLSICAIVQVMTKGKAARFKQWLSALWNLEDPELAAAYGLMQQSIEELAQTVGYASYAEIKSTQAITITISAKADEIDENIKKFRSAVGEDLRSLYESQLGLRTEIIDGFRVTHDGIGQTQAMIREQAEREARFHASVLKALQGEKSQPDHLDKDKRKPGTKGSGKGDPGDKKYKALRSIKEHFDTYPDTFPNWRDAYKENAAQEEDISGWYVKGTNDWVETESAFQQWIDGQKPLLWMQGPDGIGKTVLAHATRQKIPPRPDGHNSVAYFYFKEDFPYLRSPQNAFACAALQIAETNTRYAEMVAARLKEDGDNAADIATWQRFFFSLFTESSQGTASASSCDHLYLVFDGLDEAQEEQKDIFSKFLLDLNSEKSRVHVLVTSRLGEAQSTSKFDPLVIDVTKEKMLPGMKKLIWEQLKTFWRLNKFSLATKKTIRRKVAQKADGMLYVNHMLRRLSYIGREGAVLKALDALPDSLHDLYKLMLDECRRNRTKEQYEALKKLFAWLAFSRRSLTLAEASELIRLTIRDDDFDLEDEIIGRSARLFRLSRTRPVEEDLPDDTKDDDNEDQGEDGVLEIDEYRNSALTFQERSLRQYFRDVSVEAHGEDELRTPASAAHMTILNMCVDILMKSAEAAEDAEVSELRTYAIKYWYEHFNELDAESTSNEDLGQVLKSVHRITSNGNNVANLFERYAMQTEIYPDRETEATVPWFDRLHSWTVRASSIPGGILSDEVKAWVDTLNARPRDVLMPLARGHVQNWVNQSNRYYILEAFRFAAAALALSDRYKKVAKAEIRNCSAILDVFGWQPRNARAVRAVGTVLFYSFNNVFDDEGDENIRRLNDEHLKWLNVQAREFLERSLEIDEGGESEKGPTLSTLAIIHSRTEDYQKAVETLDEGLKMFPIPEPSGSATAKTQTSDSIVQEMYLNKAAYLQKLDRKEDSLEAYNNARRLAGDDILAAYELDEITVLLDEMAAADGHRLMDALKSWTEKERNSWFMYCFEDWPDLPAIGRMYRAAKLSGETDIVIEWLNTFGKSLARGTLAYLNLKTGLAHFYSKVIGDDEKAKDTMRTALAFQPKIGDREDSLNFFISEMRMKLASIIFSQFRATPDPQRKIELLEEMKSLPGMQDDNSFQESHIGMLLANMFRIMGPAREYQNAMDRIFQTCINGLEDNVSWNDGDSLRLLAKVLSSLDGLEHDARITLSAQFSILDRAIYAGLPSSSDTLENGGAKEPGVADTVVEKTQPNGHPDNTGEVNEIAPATKETASSPSGEETSSTNGLTADEHANDGGSPDAIETPDAFTKDENISDFNIWCDGGCGVTVGTWSRPLYLCLVCPNTDLCEDCHKKRLEWNRNDGAEPWEDFCGKNHHYIKGPMKGWRGVKDGVFRIGEEELRVKDWIKGLKEERWPKAWEGYWLRQGGLKDIDVED